ALGRVGCGGRPGVRLDRVVPLGLDPASVDAEWDVRIGRRERGIVNDGPVEGEDGGDAVDLELGQRTPRPLERLGPVGSGDDQLGQHRVEVLADDAARFHARVQADPRPGRWAEHRDGTRGGQEVGAGVLAVDPELDGVPAYWWVVVAERFTGGDTEHLTHQ